MRFPRSFILCLLPAISLAVKKDLGSRFEDYHAKSLLSAPLKLDDASYDELTGAPRNFSVVVLLTALEARFGCQLCRDFQPEWDLIGRSWARGDKDGNLRVLYGTLDFLDGKGTFQKLMLQTAPILLFFPQTVGPDAKADSQPIRYDFTAGSQSADQVYDWITRHLPDGAKPPIYRPLNYSRIVAVTTSVLGLVSILSVASPYILPIIQNRNLWAAISLIIILLFTSGHMFNHIRKVPYVSGDGKGGINYFAGGFSNQFGLETQIVAAMYGTLSFATIALALRVPRMSDPKKQQVAVFAWGGVMLVMYSFLLSVFRIKNGGSPTWVADGVFISRLARSRDPGESIRGASAGHGDLAHTRIFGDVPFAWYGIMNESTSDLNHVKPKPTNVSPSGLAAKSRDNVVYLMNPLAMMLSATDRPGPLGEFGKEPGCAYQSDVAGWVDVYGG